MGEPKRVIQLDWTVWGDDWKVTFSGPRAQEESRSYADWKNQQAQAELAHIAAEDHAMPERPPCCSGQV